MWYQTLYAPPEKDPHSKSSSASRQVQRQMSDPALMHSHVQLHQGDKCITEHNNQRVPCSHSVIYLEKSQFLWQEQPCQLVESLCTERTGLLLPELSSHAKLFPAMPFSTHFVSSECSPATLCAPLQREALFRPHRQHKMRDPAPQSTQLICVHAIVRTGSI